MPACPVCRSHYPITVSLWGHFHASVGCYAAIQEALQGLHEQGRSVAITRCSGCDASIYHDVRDSVRVCVRCERPQQAAREDHRATGGVGIRTECPHCGEPFETEWADQLYCSKRCRNRAAKGRSRSRHRQAKQLAKIESERATLSRRETWQFVAD